MRVRHFFVRRRVRHFFYDKFVVRQILLTTNSSYDKFFVRRMKQQQQYLIQRGLSSATQEARRRDGSTATTLVRLNVISSYEEIIFDLVVYQQQSDEKRCKTRDFFCFRKFPGCSSTRAQDLGPVCQSVSRRESSSRSEANLSSHPPKNCRASRA